MPISNFRRRVVVCSQTTSLSFEDRFWESLKMPAAVLGRTLARIVNEIAQRQTPRNISPSLQIFVLENLWPRIMTDDGVPRCGLWTWQQDCAATNGKPV